MSTLTVPLRRLLRDVPLARTMFVQLSTLGVPLGGAKDGVLILCYHGMRAADRARFERQLRQLRGLGDIIGLNDGLKLLAGEPIGGRYVCLTFDDGYRDAFDHAFPILAAQNVPATFFVVTGWIDERRSGVIGWSECRHLAAGGIEIGSHSVTHPHLANLDQATAETELAASRARIEAELAQPCLHFACPFGQPGEDYRPERDPAQAQQAGYRSFLTTIPGRAQAGADPWALPRVRMEPGWGTAELRYAFSR
jgi:peptidoglycan/xylan/chitin deacetylase (PgdA/CDA1 family)